MLEEILTTNVLVGSLLAILALILVDRAVRVVVSVAKGVFQWERILGLPADQRRPVRDLLGCDRSAYVLDEVCDLPR